MVLTFLKKFWRELLISILSIACIVLFTSKSKVEIKEVEIEKIVTVEVDRIVEKVVEIEKIVESKKNTYLRKEKKPDGTVIIERTTATQKDEKVAEKSVESVKEKIEAKEEIKESSKTVVSTNPEKPKYILGVQINPLNYKEYIFNGGIRLANSPFFITGSYKVKDKSFSVGISLEF